MSNSVGLPADQFTSLKQWYLDDPFAFAKDICGHRDLTNQFHRPLIYLAGGCVDQLLPLLNDPSFDSFIVRAIRSNLERRRIDWNSPEGIQRFRSLLDFVSILIYRGAGKSSSITHATTLWRMTRDPNETIALISATDDKAWSFMRQIRETILSDAYRAFFPERIPDRIDKILTEKRITLNGRTVSSPEPTLMGQGYKSNWIGTHFNRFVIDDLVGLNNCSPTELTGVREFLAFLPGLYMPEITRPVSRTHVGTRYDEEDDAGLLSRIEACFQVEIPIEVHKGPILSLTQKGEPTNPEWHPRAKIDVLRETIINDPEQGPQSWRYNYLLNPSAGGARIFPPEFVDSQKYRKVPTKDGKSFLVQLPDLNSEGEQLRTKEGALKFLLRDPMRIYRVIGCDQAFSEDGDDWAVSVVAMDERGNRIQLETRTGKGHSRMREAVSYLNEVWRPVWVGLEKGAAQETVIDLMKEDAKFASMRSKIVPVTHGSKSKEYRLRNNVAENLRMRRLWIDPDDPVTPREMKDYRPGPKAKDNILDSLSIAEHLLKRVAKAEGEDGWHARIRRSQARRRREIDPDLGFGF